MAKKLPFIMPLTFEGKVTHAAVSLAGGIAFTLENDRAKLGVGLTSADSGACPDYLESLFSDGLTEDFDLGDRECIVANAPESFTMEYYRDETSRYYGNGRTLFSAPLEFTFEVGKRTLKAVCDIDLKEGVGYVTLTEVE